MPPKTPDNQPFDFNLDAFIKGMDLTPYRVHFADQRWELKHFDGLDSQTVTKAMRQDDEDAAILKLAMGDEQYERFLETRVPVGGRKELVRRYFKHCGVDLGELRGSTNS